MAFTRAAGFARVNYAGALGERGHVVAYRDWLPATGLAPAPEILCIDNAATHDHTFSPWVDDYATFYFTSPETDLNCDTVMPRIGPFGSRPIHVANTGGGWQATCKIPPGLEKGWYEATLRTAAGPFAAPVRIGVDAEYTPQPACGIRLTRVADGKSFEDLRIHVGEGSAISVWAAGLPEDVERSRIRVRLNGSELPAIWLAPAGESTLGQSRQINALLPSGLEPGPAVITLAVNGRETESVTAELFKT
jgi:hypothetical protein